MLVAKGKEIYDTNCDELKFADKWFDGWCKEYRVSLRHPNKHFSIAQNVRKERITQFLKNVCQTRNWWMAKYKVDPPILSAGQMPLHRNEFWSQKILHFRGRDQPVSSRKTITYHENIVQSWLLHRLRKELTPPPLESLEFVFKINFQWVEKGSYWVKPIPLVYFPERCVIFTLDEYSAHLPREIFQKGSFLTHIGGGIMRRLHWQIYTTFSLTPILLTQNISSSIFDFKSKILYGNRCRSNKPSEINWKCADNES